MNVLYKIHTKLHHYICVKYLCSIVNLSRGSENMPDIPDCCTIHQAMTPLQEEYNVHTYCMYICKDILLHYSTQCVGVAVIHVVVVPLFKEHEECKLLVSLWGCLHDVWLSRLSVSCSSKHNVRCHKCGMHAHSNTVSKCHVCKLHTTAPM